MVLKVNTYQFIDFIIHGRRQKHNTLRKQIAFNEQERMLVVKWLMFRAKNPPSYRFLFIFLHLTFFSRRDYLAPNRTRLKINISVSIRTQVNANIFYDRSVQYLKGKSQLALGNIYELFKSRRISWSFQVKTKSFNFPLRKILFLAFEL